VTDIAMLYSSAKDLATYGMAQCTLKHSHAGQTEKVLYGPLAYGYAWSVHRQGEH
jgi:hypothetical protein